MANCGKNEEAVTFLLDFDWVCDPGRPQGKPGMYVSVERNTMSGGLKVGVNISQQKRSRR
jgi:hypothetical protein